MSFSTTAVLYLSDSLQAKAVLFATGASPQSRGVNGKKAGRQSTGAMNLLASAAEDNEAFENTLTNAQIQQLQLQQQLALQQPQLQVTSMFSCAAVLFAPVEVLLLFIDIASDVLSYFADCTRGFGMFSQCIGIVQG